MCKLYAYHTGIGPIYISRLRGWYIPVHENQPLGCFSTPQQAVEAVARGSIPQLNCARDTVTLGIPSDLRRWELVGFN